MITRAYYRKDPLTASINIKNIVNCKPTGYTLYISHKLDGIICNKEVATIDDAFKNATVNGCNRDLWEVYPKERK